MSASCPCMVNHRERLARSGASALDDAELLATLLGTGTRSTPVTELARELLESLGGIQALAHVEVGQLRRLDGLGPSKAAQIVAAIELGRRALIRPLPRGRRVASSKDVDAALRPLLAGEPVEHFIALLLDAKHRPMGTITLAIGGLTSCAVELSSVFGAILRRGAAAVVFAHNHPSGVPVPSPDDMTLTRRLKQGGEILGIEVLDHVIIGREGFYSFLDAGELEEEWDPCCSPLQ